MPDNRKWRGAKAILGFGCALLLVGFVVVLSFNPESTGREVVGTVQSAGAVSLAGVHGATREAASVKLSNGRIVSALVVSGGPLSPGASVTLLERSRLWGAPSYEVVAAHPIQ